MRDIHALPAYGRDYRSAEQVRDAWKQGKDFRDALSGRYFSRNTAEIAGHEVWVRYARQTKILRVQ